MNNQTFGQFVKQVLAANVRSVVPFLVVALLVVIVGAVAWGWWFFFVGLAFYALFFYLSLRNVYMGISAGTGGAGLPGAGNYSFDLSRLSGKYRAAVERAVNSKTEIEQAIPSTTDAGTQRALQDATHDLPELVYIMHTLAVKAQSVETVLQSSNAMQRLAEEIKGLDEQFRSTEDALVRGQLQSALDGKQQQMQSLTDTTAALNDWDGQMDEALSALDTVRTEISGLGSSGALTGSEASRISSSIRQQIDSLKATSDTLESVYSMSNR